MGKRILSVLCALLLSLSIFSQIQRDFYGLQLAHSGRSDIVKQFKESGKIVSEADDNISVESLNFCGEDWPFVTFYFYKNTLCSVQFLNFEIVTPKDKLDLVWNHLNQLLITKYNGIDSVATDEVRSYKDNETLVSLNYTTHNGSKCIVFMYFDLNMMQAKETDSKK